MRHHFLIPENVLKILPDLYKRFQSIPGFSQARLKEVLTVISMNTQDDGWTPVKMEYIRWLVPGAENYLKILRDLSIIERGGSYVPGVTSFKYRFLPDFTSKYKRLPIDCPKLIRRIENRHQGGEKQNRKKRNSKIHPRQNELIRELRIIPEALNFIDSISNVEKYNYSIAAYTRIDSGQIYYVTDTTAGRYHSPITNLPCDLREFIRIRENKLINIDIKNSQPYFSILLLVNPEKVAELFINEKISMMLKSLQVKQTEDVKKYVSLVKRGRFYEYLGRVFNKAGHNLTREDVKKKAFQILFGSNRQNSAFKKIFVQQFQEVSRVFGLIKKEDHRILAVLLQRVEAHVILDVILPQIYDYGIIAVSIHDSIMVPQTDIVFVRRIMEMELTRFVGSPPRLKVDINIKMIESVNTIQGIKKVRRRSLYQYDVRTLATN